MTWHLVTINGKCAIISKEKPFGGPPWLTDEGERINSLKGQHETREEAFAAVGNDLVCVECGGLVFTHYIEPVKSRLIQGSICHRCDHYRGLVAEKDGLVIIDGCAYTVGPENRGGGPHSGFGGSRFFIEMNDGRKITTTNLWCCSHGIPEHFRERLPDNARFTKGDRWVEIGDTRYMQRGVTP